ncbi:MAG: hypothetical protein ABI045_06920 [Flavobacteriales bacterium]
MYSTPKIIRLNEIAQAFDSHNKISIDIKLIFTLALWSVRLGTALLTPKPDFINTQRFEYLKDNPSERPFSPDIDMQKTHKFLEIYNRPIFFQKAFVVPSFLQKLLKNLGWL